MRYMSMKAALVTSAAVGRFSNRWRSQMPVCTNVALSDLLLRLLLPVLPRSANTLLESDSTTLALAS